MACCGLLLLIQAQQVAAPVPSPPPLFADDGLCWLLLVGISLFDAYLVYEVLALCRQWKREDAHARATIPSGALLPQPARTTQRRAVLRPI